MERILEPGELKKTGKRGTESENFTEEELKALSESDRKLYKSLEGVKTLEEALPKVFKAASEVPDKMEVLNELKLSMEDLDEEDLDQFLRIEKVEFDPEKDKGSDEDEEVKEYREAMGKYRDAMEKFRDHMETQLNYEKWERSAYAKTAKLIDKLPYGENVRAEKEIAAVRKKHLIDPKEFNKLKSKERLFYIRGKNMELNAIMRKYFITKGGERIDFGREEPEKYETRGDALNRDVRGERSEEEKYLSPKMTEEEKSALRRSSFEYRPKKHWFQRKWWKFWKTEEPLLKQSEKKKNKAA